MKLPINLNIRVDVTEEENRRLEDGLVVAHIGLKRKIQQALSVLGTGPGDVELLDMGEYNVEFTPVAHSKSEYRRLQTMGLPVQLPCDHDWQEQPGEPPIDVCTHCGAVRR